VSDAAYHAHVACESRKLSTETASPRNLIKRRGIHSSGITLQSRILTRFSLRAVTDSGRRGRKKRKRNRRGGFKCGGQVI
jgi:hypothetical protein